MANSLGAYNATFFAQEALIQLEKALGLASRVYRGYEAERASYGVGDTVNVPVPSSFAAQDHAPGSGTTAQDIEAGTVPIRLDRHKEVKFAVSDRDLAYASERIIDDHLRPAAYALADSIDQDLCGLYRFVPWAVDVTGSAGAGWVTSPRRRLRELMVPVDDGNLHLMVDPAIEQDFLGLDIFHAALVTGGTANQDALLRGSLGTRFGAEIFVNQNVRSHAAGTLVASGSDLEGVLDGAVARGAASIAVDGFADGATVKAGDSFTIAGHAQHYVATADVTLAGGAGSIPIYPESVRAYDSGALLTFETGPESFSANLMFHRNFAALVLAPLPATGDGRGAQIETVTDPVTGLSLRARMWYDGDTATNFVALDVLYGLTVLDGNLAVRLRRPLA
ncbi:MAG: hypothetical protein KJ904_18730 [Alphaproteobacteria bacterium]|nr:hypothetical protein [Alphaproteobacteria bacterium]MBU0796286.1 hypothetical protein [Alphaproteobacteria bacterium]MBU0889197.1 hypothetical protein [Alphaproteobacteria bacterium]MBU1812231.1 hypothetical protein [Alphaproteobacteria bacterium]